MKCPRCGLELSLSLECKNCSLLDKLEKKTKRIDRKISHYKKLSSCLSIEKEILNDKKEKKVDLPNKEDEIYHYIICAPFVPMKLSKNVKFKIGREQTNHLILPSQEVSRFHAVIKWEKDSYFLIDLESANGTFLNDDYVEKHQLKDGDNIHIGSNLIIYRKIIKELLGILNLNVSKNSLKETIKLGGGLQKGNRLFRGNIETIGLFPILQMLALENKTGCLKIKYKKETFFMYVLDGFIVNCYGSDLADYEAFFKIIKFQEGEFQFELGIEPQEITMKEKIEMMLLESARIMDEESKT